MAHLPNQRWRQLNRRFLKWLYNLYLSIRESFCAFWSSFLSFGHKNDNFDKKTNYNIILFFLSKNDNFMVILIIKAKVSNFILKDILKNQKSVFREKNIFQNILPREQKKGLFFIKSNVTLFKTKRFHFLCWFYLPKKLQGFRKKLPD